MRANCFSTIIKYLPCVRVDPATPVSTNLEDSATTSPSPSPSQPPALPVPPTNPVNKPRLNSNQEYFHYFKLDNANITTEGIPPVWNDTKPFVPPITGGYVIKVYDGDTITIAAKLPYDESPLYRFPVRLLGIDSPEMKSKNQKERAEAHVSQEALSNLILHKRVTLKNMGTEKYGRILADVYLDDLHLNIWMLEQKLAIAYDGGTKAAFTS